MDHIRKVRLLTIQHYPAAWIFHFPPLLPGQIVPVVPANNLPNSEGKYWVNTPELENDAYGILLEPGDYELLETEAKES